MFKKKPIDIQMHSIDSVCTILKYTSDLYYFNAVSGFNRKTEGGGGRRTK